jgi:hypothetical protein
MSNLICPKCGGTDYFLSQRNVVKGAGYFLRGSMPELNICRVCDEIMSLPEQTTMASASSKTNVVVLSLLIVALLVVGITYGR